ncbi:hypothetical protein JMJ35_008281 [Cladonia borealis]|uniref:S-adenosyl-L-methionine-dependent methyltransferase n=1 Tax=Cladonia borealis TaxID=184061 RepID=A0AA39QVL7_9LECA|nr:hypothetical protein JMJ35_008281 [Cladonia borealis]
MASGSAEIPVDEGYEDDGSSIFEDSSRMSMVSSFKHYRLENNRKYHTYRDGAYWMPHDDEALRLDLIAHHLFLLTFNDKLMLAPLQNPKRVIDIGTGIGVWASDFADLYPEAEVIGTDLSPTQRVPQPPNLKWETDDACSEWVYPPDYFDYVHVRLLYASIADWSAFYKECYDHLAPGGYLEHAEISPVLKSDDGSIDMDEAYHHQGRLAIEASERFGKQINIQPHLKDMILQAGFEDVKEFTYKWPIGEWPQDPRLKDIGGWNARHWMEGLETWTLRLLTQYMGWSLEEVKTWTAKMRTSILNRKFHAYQPLTVVYARKPLNPRRTTN